jgi:hypothetical protein
MFNKMWGRGRDEAPFVVGGVETGGSLSQGEFLASLAAVACQPKWRQNAWASQCGTVRKPSGWEVWQMDVEMR